MARVTYNDVSFEAPDGWQDASIVSLVAPQPEALPMMRAKQSTSERPSIVLTRASAAGLRFSLDDYAKSQERILDEIMEDLEVIERGELHIGEGDGALPVALREVAFKGPEGGVLRQAHAYVRVGDVMFTISATGSHDASFKAVREQFMAIVKSFRPSAS